MTSKFSQEFGNIICFNKQNIINNLIKQNIHNNIDIINDKYNKLTQYFKEFIDYIYNYRYNIDNIDNNDIFFETKINDDFIINNSNYIQHMAFLTFSYFRDFNNKITDDIKNNIINVFNDTLIRII